MNPHGYPLRVDSTTTDRPAARPVDPERVARARARGLTPDDAARLTSLLSLLADLSLIHI